MGMSIVPIVRAVFSGRAVLKRSVNEAMSESRERI
jgi:hypothetical protein